MKNNHKNWRSAITEYFKIEKNPTRGLIPLEWVMLGYVALTLLVAVFTYTRSVNPDTIIFGRVRIVAMTLALWLAYRLVPCRITMGARCIAQLALLAWWYPDLYELNRVFPNQDHVFAALEQSLFGCQPSLEFSRVFSWPLISEILEFGYVSYYFLIAATVLYYYTNRYAEFRRSVFVIMTSFFAFYLIFIFIPAAGPTFYFKAVGIDNIRQGVFPHLGTYFSTHSDLQTDCLPTPGWKNGLAYYFVYVAKIAGERPSAAFPSSHVGVTTVVMLLAWHSRSRRLFFAMLPFAVALFFATFYIQAHYLIDAIAGLIVGALFYFVLMYVSRGYKK